MFSCVAAAVLAATVIAVEPVDPPPAPAPAVSSCSIDFEVSGPSPYGRWNGVACNGRQPRPSAAQIWLTLS
ncbi:hypothetical protein SAMN05421748_120181 [Paractinoplanes atraurantiacus]|uniref:Uncharacterized protein n=1 Tax=Paractinoplanes atraurantiacus TaxID=1036182 RepID=A0A285JKK5_9ACTN|nr:hypothetical protein SAMN05421748_120181 [Actinoplanes atraurantiacus]